MRSVAACSDLLERMARDMTRLGRPRRAPWSVCIAVTIALGYLLSACSGASSASRAPRSSSAPSTPARTSEDAGIVFGVDATQASRISIVVRFLQTLDGGDTTVALSLFALDGHVGVSDCDYAAKKPVEFNGKQEVAAWLASRVADHDRFTLGRISNANPDEPSSAIGIEYTRRESNTLARLGFTHGIVPRVVTKVRFNADSSRIEEFANGPVGSPDPTLCVPM